jgi:glucose-1-phosphate adenylyltransferase
VLPPSKFVSAANALCLENCLIASGCVIAGPVTNSVLSPGVRVGPGAQVSESILWDGVEIGAGAQVRRAVIEDGVKVPAGFTIGHHPKADARRFHVTEDGIAVVPNNVRLEE